MKIKYEMLTDQGLKRKNNQDRICAYLSDDAALFAVADGMGGHENGEYASTRIVEHIARFWDTHRWNDDDIWSAVDSIIECMNTINNELYIYAAEKNIICGSTLSVLLLLNDTYAVINIGDSPVFLVDRYGISHISTEQSYDVIRLKSTLTVPSDIDPKRKGRLIQAIGVKQRIFPNVRTDKIRSKTAFLLCSDGVSKYYSEKQIKKMLASVRSGKTEVKEQVSLVKEQVYAKGASDNFSEIFIYVS